MRNRFRLPAPSTNPLRHGGKICVLGVLLLANATAQAFVPSCPPPQPLSTAERWSGQAAWQTLAAKGYRIGKIKIEVANVFGPHEPDHNRWYAQAANTIHLKTRPSVIRSLLLFKSGDPVNPRVIYETVRRLRDQSFVRAASILPASCRGKHTVAVRISVKDAWTLKLDVRFEVDPISQTAWQRN